MQGFGIWDLLGLSVLLSLILYMKTKDKGQSVICFGLSLILPPIGWLFFLYMMVRKTTATQ